MFAKFHQGAQPAPRRRWPWASRSAARSCGCMAADLGRARARGRNGVPLHLPVETRRRLPPEERRRLTWSGRATILVVEDEPEIRRFLRSSLGAEGYKVVESATGGAGLHRRRHPQAGSRHRRPRVAGSRWMEVIRRIAHWSPMPIIVLSARAQRALEDRRARRRRRRLRHQAVRCRRVAGARAGRAPPPCPSRGGYEPVALGD